MKIPFLKICIFISFVVLLCDISSAKRSSGGRSRGKSSGTSGWWGGRRKGSDGSSVSQSVGQSSSSGSGSSSAAQPPKPVAKSESVKAKPSSSFLLPFSISRTFVSKFLNEKGITLKESIHQTEFLLPFSISRTFVSKFLNEKGITLKESIHQSECSSARRRTSGSRKKTKTSSPRSDPPAPSSDDSSTQSKSDSKSTSDSKAGSYPMQTISETKPYPPTQKIADVKPSAPVESPYLQKTTSKNQLSNSNIQPSSTGWNIPRQELNNFNTQGGSQLPRSSLPAATTAWNIPASQSHVPQHNENLQYKGGWASGYQNSQASKSSSLSDTTRWNIPASQSHVPQRTDNMQSKSGWTSGYQSPQVQSATRWNIPGSQSNIQQRTDNMPSKGGWTSGYQGAQRVETPLKKDTSKLQQSSPNQPQPPQAGWNVPGQNNAQGANAGGWKSGYQNQGAPPAYPHNNVAPPSYNGQSSWGAPPAYPGHAPGGYGGYGHSAPGGYGGQTGGYGGFGHSAPGGYGGQTGGYGGYGGGGGGYGGYGAHPQQSVGGYNPGYGGMSTAGMGMGRGGMGGVGGFGGGYGGGYGGGGYPMQKKSSFFSASTIGSVVAGMLVYNMASSLISYGLGTKRPYTVVNYYNQESDKKVEEIKLPSNVLTLCEGNATQLCGQGTQAVCTQNGTVLCVATMNQAAPCDQGGNKALCVSTTVPCVDANDPLCQNSTHKDKLEVDVNVPCFTNLTLDVNLVDKSQTQPNTKYTYCVTTMAIAGPEYNVCADITETNDYRSVLNGNSNWFLETDGFRRNYSVYNYDRPMETNGEINMPITVLIKCSESAMKICAPGTIATCTSFNEIMCMVALADVQECSETNSTCIKSNIPCPDGSTDALCQNKTDGIDTVTLDLPCFANVTMNAPIPKFSLAEYNGTLPDLTTTSSYTYHFNYCVVSLALPGSDFDLCITKEAKEKQDKEQKKS